MHIYRFHYNPRITRNEYTLYESDEGGREIWVNRSPLAKDYADAVEALKKAEAERDKAIADLEKEGTDKKAAQEALKKAEADKKAAEAALAKAEAALKAATQADGATHREAAGVFTVTSSAKRTVEFTKAANKKNITVPNTVVINGVTFTVTSIAPYAFTAAKNRTVTIKATKLTKKSVKNSLAGSKVKTIKIKVLAKKKANKKYVKKYKKFFTAKNAGKAVSVK